MLDRIKSKRSIIIIVLVLVIAIPVGIFAKVSYDKGMRDKYQNDYNEYSLTMLGFHKLADGYERLFNSIDKDNTLYRNDESIKDTISTSKNSILLVKDTIPETDSGNELKNSYIEYYEQLIHVFTPIYTGDYIRFVEQREIWKIAKDELYEAEENFLNECSKYGVENFTIKLD